MKKILFSGTGFPGGIKTLQTLQDNTLNVVQGLARQHENYTVLYGMEVNGDGTVISAGAFVYNGEIIPFVESATGTTITINETVESANFNTNPSSESSLELLPAYSIKSAQTGTGGIHTFNTSQLKRYVNRRILAKGVVTDENIHFSALAGFPGAIVNVSIPTQAEPYEISYTLRTEGTVSTIATHEHMIIDSHANGFRIAIRGERYELRTYKIEWQIYKV